MPGITSKSSPGCYVTTSTGYVGAPVEAGDRGQPMPGVVCRSSGVVHILGWVLIYAAGIQCCQKISSGAPLCGHSVSWSRLPEGAMGMGGTLHQGECHGSQGSHCFSDTGTVPQNRICLGWPHSEFPHVTQSGFPGVPPRPVQSCVVSIELQHLLVETANVCLVPKQVPLCCCLSSLGAEGVLGQDKTYGMVTCILGKQGCAAAAGRQTTIAVSHGIEEGET